MTNRDNRADNGLPFDFDQPQDSPGFLLWQTTITWQRLIKKELEPYDISHSQFVIMVLLLWLEAHKYDTTQVLIASWSKLDKMTISKSLKKLALQELVQRSEHGVDTRAKTVYLTDKGRTLMHKLVLIVEGVDSKFFGKIHANDQVLLMKVLKQLIER